MAKEKEEPVHLSRQWRHQAGKGFDHCKEQRVPPGDLRFFESESDDPPPAPIIPANFLRPPNLWLLCVSIWHTLLLLFAMSFST